MDILDKEAIVEYDFGDCAYTYSVMTWIVELWQKKGAFDLFPSYHLFVNKHYRTATAHWKHTHLAVPLAEIRTRTMQFLEFIVKTICFGSFTIITDIPETSVTWVSDGDLEDWY